MRFIHISDLNHNRLCDILNQICYKVFVMLYTSQSLPLCQTTLDDWQLIKITGADSVKFLQGQLTSDLTKLTDQNFVFSAQCDPKGKVWSNMLFFKRGDDIYYLERKSVVETQLKELKKYAIFSKVQFDIETHLIPFGIMGNDTTDGLTRISALFENGQNCITVNHVTYLKITFPTTRYLVIASADDITAHCAEMPDLVENSQQWAILDMEAHYPIIDLPVSNQYLPQAFNLQNFDAISFDKGCYCGQEMVARAQYRGINKRALYLLIGHTSQLPQIGDTLEQQMGENWRETGCVLAVIRLNEHTVWIQAILNNDLEDNTKFRVKGITDSQFTIQTNQSHHD